MCLLSVVVVYWIVFWVLRVLYSFVSIFICYCLLSMLSFSFRWCNLMIIYCFVIVMIVVVRVIKFRDWLVYWLFYGIGFRLLVSVCCGVWLFSLMLFGVFLFFVSVGVRDFSYSLLVFVLWIRVVFFVK